MSLSILFRGWSLITNSHIVAFSEFGHFNSSVQCNLFQPFADNPTFQEIKWYNIAFFSGHSF